MANLQNFSAPLRLGEKKIKQLFSQRRRDAKGTKQKREVFFHFNDGLFFSVSLWAVSFFCLPL